MKVFTRTACLGGWVIEEKFGRGHTFLNQQKVRADLFMDFVNKKTNPPPMKRNIDAWLKRKDMAGIYLQTQILNWLVSGRPDLVIMDNYSELVDKRFDSNEGWSFCGLYGEFKPEFIQSLTDNGLLENVHDAYDKLFGFIKVRWNVPIVFIHFPTVFDTREKYIKQGQKITDALNVLSSKYNIVNIHADPNSIEQKDSDYYHFTSKTVKNIASKLKL